MAQAGPRPIRTRGLTVRHFSWWRILTMAIEQKEHRGISDPDQAGSSVS